MEDGRKRGAGGGSRRPPALPTGLPIGLLAALVACAAGLLAAAILFHATLAAQARAAVVLVSFLEVPVASPVVGVLTGEPRLTEGRVAGNQALISQPASEGPHPAIFFVNGAVPQGRDLPEARRLAASLARAGYLVVLPDLPGLKEYEIRPHTADEAAEVAREISRRPDVRDGEVALVGVSTGASLALLAAERPRVEERVSVVAGVAPYADIRTVFSVATTGHHEKDGRLVPYPPDPYLPYVAGHSLIAAVPDPGDREVLESRLERVKAGDEDPLSTLRGMPVGDLGPEAGAVRRLLANRDPRRFDDLYAALPRGMRRDMRELSPVAGAERLDAPVELVTGPRDRYFPPSESYDLLSVAPERRVTVTGVLDHSEVRLSAGDLAGLWKLNGFVVRALREAG